MKLEINHHNYDTNKFRELKQLYPTGTYDDSNNVYWFVLFIEGVEITWYRERRPSK